MPSCQIRALIAVLRLPHLSAPFWPITFSSVLGHHPWPPALSWMLSVLAAQCPYTLSAYSLLPGWLHCTILTTRHPSSHSAISCLLFPFATRRPH